MALSLDSPYDSVYYTLQQARCAGSAWSNTPVWDRRLQVSDSYSGLALLTDLYQLTMAYGYWARGRADRRAIFHLSFRRSPFGGRYAVAAGLQPALDYISNYRFTADDLEYLATLAGNDGQRLFPDEFLRYLESLRLSVDVDAIPEGTVVFPHEPLLRIEGSLLECQLLESTLLNLLNYQTLIATKASRVVAAAGGDTVLEFGLRRAQGINGALAASRAAFIGGCQATSNVLAGKLYGIPVRGTHAHSWVMSHDSELVAFDEYAQALPNNCVFLVDTYDTLQGVRRAIEVGRRLQTRGHRMVGIRLDSGDLAWLSVQARRLLDQAGFTDAVIVASNDLDERLIQSLKHQDAQITVWGVGTKLVTGHDQPALGGVYKLSAIEDDQRASHDLDGDMSGTDRTAWRPVMKLSEQPIKNSIPGKLQVRRYYRDDGTALADVIYNELAVPQEPWTALDPEDPTRPITGRRHRSFRDLLVPMLRMGKKSADLPSLIDIQRHATSELATFHAGIRRFDHPHRYPVGLEQGLHELRQRLMLEGRAEIDSDRSGERR